MEGSFGLLLLFFSKEEIKAEPDKTEDLIEKQFKLEERENELKNIIETVSLRRDGSNKPDTESYILNYIKKGSKPDSSSLKDTIETISECCNDNFEFDLNNKPGLQNKKSFLKYTEDFLDLLDFILNKIKFCLICITGENTENFVINLFNTLNTTGQALTAFEVLKSELYTIDKKLSNKIDKLQSDIIDKYKRKEVVLHTGKLLLYLALYRGDFNEEGYVLSDRKFKNQRGYLKQVLDKDSAKQLVEDIQKIDGFYSKYWLKSDSLSSLLKNKNEQVCFKFLSKLKHNRVLPILIRFYENNKTSFGKCVKQCTAFSTLWRAFHNGGNIGIDSAYKNISKHSKPNADIKELNKNLKDLFLKNLDCKNFQESKSKWIQKLKTSTIYKNQTLSKFLLFLAYNQRYFNEDKKILEKGKGTDILNEHFWEHKDYKTIEHIIPKSSKQMIGHIHTLGNLTLLPQALNSSLGDKTFQDKLLKYKEFCKKENEDKYPYLPIIKHITKYNEFTKIEECSEILSEFIWQTLAEDWLGWKD